MKRMAAMLVCLTVCLAVCLSGCSSVSQIEGQAYAVSMAIDQEDDGQVTLSVQAPTFGASTGGGGASESGSEGSSEMGYILSSATGFDFKAAMTLLDASIPRALNLTQLKSVVVSEKTARSGALYDILKSMQTAYRVYGEASLVICAGEAKKLLEGQKPLIGLRLSDAVTMAIENYQRLGTIPKSVVSETFYRISSLYGDPVAIYAAVADGKNGEERLPEGSEGEGYAGMLPREGENPDEYFGSALLREGVMVGRLTGEQTQLLNILLGREDMFNMVCADVNAAVQGRGVRVRTDLTGAAPSVTVSLTLGVTMTDATATQEALKEDFVKKLDELTALCQSLKVDPFGYAENAAHCFATIDEWTAYDWRERFSQAQVNYDVRIVRITT